MNLQAVGLALASALKLPSATRTPTAKPCGRSLGAVTLFFIASESFLRSAKPVDQVGFTDFLIFKFHLQLVAYRGLGWLAVDAAEFVFSAGFAGARFVAADFGSGAVAVGVDWRWEIGFDLRDVAILV